jgi:hypothetical protein
VRLPTLFRGRDYAALPAGDTSSAPRGEAGSDGESWFTDVWGGGPDINPELTGSAKFDVYDEMYKTDASIKSLVWFLMLPVRGANWGLNPRDNEDPVDIAIRDMVAENLGIGEGNDGWLDLSWDECNQQSLVSMMKFGPCLEELVWDDVREWVDADGDTHLVRPLASLAFRHPRTIRAVKRDKGRLVSVEQDLPNTRPIPRDKLSYMVFERDGSRWDGVSLLRPAWLPWRTKKALTIASGIGWDRFASGLPIIWHPDDPESETLAREIGRSIRQHERGYVHFPVPKDGSSKNDSLWDLELKNGAATLADPVPILKWLTEQIAEAGMQQFTKLGMTDTGSRAVADVQVDPFYLAVQSLAHYLRRERARQVIRKIVEINFGREAAEKRSPILTVSKIQARNVQVIANAISVLDAAGFAFTDRDVQNDVREMLGFPLLPEADLAAAGIDRQVLLDVLNQQGLTPEQFSGIVNALPADVGIARNRVNPREGDGLARAAEAAERARRRTHERKLEDELEQVREQVSDRHDFEEGLRSQLVALAEQLLEVKLVAEQKPDPVDLSPLERRLEQLAAELDAARDDRVDEAQIASTFETRIAPLRELVAEIRGAVAEREPRELHVVVNGERRPARARVRKDGDTTIVDYEVNDG